METIEVGDRQNMRKFLRTVSIVVLIFGVLATVYCALNLQGLESGRFFGPEWIARDRTSLIVALVKSALILAAGFFGMLESWFAVMGIPAILLCAILTGWYGVSVFVDATAVSIVASILSVLMLILVIIVKGIAARRK